MPNQEEDHFAQLLKAHQKEGLNESSHMKPIEVVNDMPYTRLIANGFREVQQMMQEIGHQLQNFKWHMRVQHYAINTSMELGLGDYSAKNCLFHILVGFEDGVLVLPGPVIQRLTNDQIMAQAAMVNNGTYQIIQIQVLV